MKFLTIIRHAKSDWGTVKDDFHRTLAQRGREAAPLMGRRFLREFIEPGRVSKPDILISSPATRAITTAKLIAEEIGFSEAEIVKEERIYEASLQRLLNVIEEIEDRFEHAVLFGHNPGFEMLADTLAGKSVGDHDGKFPTCGVAIFKVAAESWTWLDETFCELVDFLYPRQLPAD